MGSLYYTSKFELASLMCLIGLTLALFMHVSQAQNSPQDYLAPHNAARAEVGVGPITWDDTIAAFSRDYANQRSGDCNLIHSGGGGRYGENLAGSSGALSATDAVKLWVSEKRFYNYGSNSCQGGECLHYTQVVWRNSVRLGCASVTCRTGGTFVICNYGPPGNYVGQRPY
ncbi:Allergen V5/Tpx-1-related [Macleaya cordata]|uniref:Allergen V5/Tpx-1-related n=1 Tax=Macleaya cordata TaxID=56857 RepID=A0A200R033_MACCD|nr:Allergen V5/Tpx-1-related [Macleaya cordata]